MQDLFTIICESSGGTYIKQIGASDASQALQQWMDWIRSFREVPLFALEAQSLDQELRKFELASVQECQNVWSGVASLALVEFSIYIIKTQAE